MLMANIPESTPYNMPVVVANAQTRAEWALGIPPVLSIYRRFNCFSRSAGTIVFNAWAINQAAIGMTRTLLSAIWLRVLIICLFFRWSTYRL